MVEIGQQGASLHIREVYVLSLLCFTLRYLTSLYLTYFLFLQEIYREQFVTDLHSQLLV